MAVPISGFGTGYVLATWSYDGTGQLGLLDESVAYQDLDADRTADYTITVDPQTYDTRSRLLATVWTVDGGEQTPPTYRVDWTYDEADRIETIEYPSMGGSRETVTYDYDPRTGMPTDLDTDWTTDTVITDAADWLPSGQPGGWVLGSNSDKLYRSWLYKTSSQRLWRINVGTTSGDNDVVGLRYYYDAGGNIERLRDDHNKTGGVIQIQCFGYDDLSRLTEAYTKKAENGCDGTHDSTGDGAYNYLYEYNSIGNLLKIRDRDDIGNWLIDWDYNDTAVNAGAHAAHHWQESGQTARTYEYDLNGNIIDRDGDTLTYDADNRLAKYDKASSSDDTEFVYDADGTRILRIGSSTTTTYIGGVYETDGTVETAYYTFGGETVALRIDDGTGDDRYWLIGDHLGSAVATVDATDNSSVSRQLYHPYGETRGTTSVGETDRLYTGQVSDSDETGLLFYNARYYDPTLRRFVASDSIVPDPARPQGLSRYSYVINNPMRYSDPSGHCWWVPGSGDSGCPGAQVTQTALDWVSTGSAVVVVGSLIVVVVCTACAVTAMTVATTAGTVGRVADAGSVVFSCGDALGGGGVGDCLLDVGAVAAGQLIDRGVDAYVAANAAADSGVAALSLTEEAALRLAAELPQVAAFEIAPAIAGTEPTLPPDSDLTPGELAREQSLSNAWATQSAFSNMTDGERAREQSLARAAESRGSSFTSPVQGGPR